MASTPISHGIEVAVLLDVDVILLLYKLIVLLALTREEYP